MRASDLALPEGMEIYLDMDGVLADFFHEYAKLAGVPANKYGKHDYRSIPPAKADPTLDKMIGTDFFARLPKFPTTDKLINISVEAAGGYNICSSPLRGDHEGSAKYKSIWIKDQLPVQPKHIYITPNKAKYAKNANGMPNVLIDDRGSNITAWEAAGGIGIKYQADEDSLKVVLDGLKRARRVAVGQEKHEPQQLVSKDRGGSNAIATAQDNVKEDQEKQPHIKEILKAFLPIVMKELHLEKLPTIKLLKYVPKEEQPTFGRFVNGERVVYVGIEDRHPLDIMRTLAHELVHYKQLLQGKLGKCSGKTGSPEEDEAHEKAGVIMRHFDKKYPDLFKEPSVDIVADK